MNIAKYASVFAIASLTFLGGVNAASFDCAKAATPLEKTICGSTRLSELDEKLGEAYKSARAASIDPTKLKNEQIEWIKEARNCQSDAICVERVYIARLSELSPQSSKTTQEQTPPSPVQMPSSVEQQANAPQPAASAIEAVPAAAVASAEATPPTAVASAALVAGGDSKPSIFSDAAYQKYALIAGGVVLALIAAYFIIKLLVSLAKKAAAKVSSAARVSVSKISEEASNLKEGLSNKAQDISSQAKVRASVLATDFNKEGGLKDQIKSMSQKSLDGISKVGADLKQEAANINNIRVATIQSSEAETKKKDLLISFWTKLTSKQKLLLISILLISIMIISSLSGGSTTQGVAPSAFRNPQVVANELGMPGVSRCMAIVIIWSAGLAKDTNTRADGPEIRNNNNLMEFYGEARRYVIGSMNNPAAEGAMDNMFRQQGEYFNKLAQFQGWDALMPTYKDCAQSAYK